MELVFTSLFFVLFGALLVLFAEAFWLKHMLKTGKVAHIGGKLVVMYTSEFRNQIKTITDLRILAEEQQEQITKDLVASTLQKVEATKTRKPRVSKKKVVDES